MKEFTLRIHRRGLVILLVIILLIFTVWFIKKATASEPIYSCTQAHAKGIYNIKKGDKNYRPSLDRDSDGIACE